MNTKLTPAQFDLRIRTNKSSWVDRTVVAIFISAIFSLVCVFSLGVSSHWFVGFTLFGKLVMSVMISYAVVGIPLALAYFKFTNK